MGGELQHSREASAVVRLLVLALGFGCFMAYSRMLALGFDGFLDLGAVGDGQFLATVRAGARVATLLVLAVAGWRRLFSVGRALLVTSCLAMLAATILLPFVGSSTGGAVMAVVLGVANAIVMYVWVMLLSEQQLRRIVQSGVVAIVVAGVLLMGAPHLPTSLRLVLIALSALVCGLVPLYYDPGMLFARSDGPLSRNDVARISWFAVIVLIICGVCGTVLYGISTEVIWRYGQEPNYAAFGIAAVATIGITCAIMLGEGDWTQAVWVPLFILFLVAVVFSCFATSEALEVSVGLLLACMFCFHFLRFIVFPGMMQVIGIPRAFVAAALLIVTNSFFASRAGEAVGAMGEQSLRGLAQMAGLMAVVVLALFAVMVVLFMRRPSQAAVVASFRSQVEDTPGASAEDIVAARMSEVANIYGLTEREVEVAGLSAQGFNAPYIAEKLVVSQSTVRFHLQNVYRKMGIHSRSELIELVSLAPVDGQ